MKLRRFPVVLLVLVFSFLAVSARADTILGYDTDLSSAAVLAASTVTNTGPTTITGDVDLYPGTSITGESDITLTGASVYEDTTATAMGAQADLTDALTELEGLGPGTTLASSNLTGLTFAPGVYTVPGNALLNVDGTVTLDGEGNANAAWVFLVDGFTTGTGSSVVVENTGAGAGIYWVDSSSTTLGVDSSFEGNILASTSIALDQGATDDCGRALASTGAVTMDNNTVSIGCADTEGSGGSGFSGGLSVTPVVGGPAVVTVLPFSPLVSAPEPSTFALLLSGLLAICLLALRKSRPIRLTDRADAL
jgi:hypothetical protein